MSACLVKCCVGFLRVPRERLSREVLCWLPGSMASSLYFDVQFVLYLLSGQKLYAR